MIYRNFKNLEIQSSILGLGTMRLPIIGNDNNHIDEEKAIALIRYAIDNGINYIDTAYPYHGGNSESVVGKALLEGYREKITLATKNPVWKVKEYEDFESYLNKQLEKLQTDCIDIYLLHSLSKKSWDRIKKLDVLKFIDEAKAKGKIKLAGFSIHDNFDAFEEILDSYTWDMCLIQLNYMDYEEQVGLKGLEYASSKEVPVVIMEPLKGGLLATPPNDIKDKLREIRSISPVEWSFKWLADHSSVKVILSGMSSLEQMVENISIAERLIEENMTEEDFNVIDEIREMYHKRSMIPCTQCKYCVPCPIGVDIPGNFKLFNDANMYSTFVNSQYQYNLLMQEEEKASHCIECRQCESKCPQKIIISQEMKRVDDLLKTERKFESFHWNY